MEGPFPRTPRKPKSELWQRGWMRAEDDFINDTTAYKNPFVHGSEEWHGYEEAVDYLTQK